MSVVKGLNYLKALAEVAVITCVVVSLSFCVGVILKQIFG